MKNRRQAAPAQGRSGRRAAPIASSLTRDGDHWKGSFSAMASPCELLLDPIPFGEAQRLLRLVSREVWRIERKFSRYRSDSVLGRLHAAGGVPFEVDDETAGLLDFATQCWTLSDGLFDITSGGLRRAWSFDGSDRIPTSAQIRDLLPFVGWSKVEWTRPLLRLPAGMEIDLGGLGKEYAVDRAADMARAETDASFLLNLGGDLTASGPRADGWPWRVGIEDPAAPDRATRLIEIRGGALATSGDSRRYLLKDGVRYSHILSPFTGWPIPDAPRSVTVAAPRCTEAGMLATLALLQGSRAEEFLESGGTQSWCVR